MKRPLRHSSVLFFAGLVLIVGGTLYIVGQALGHVGLLQSNFWSSLFEPLHDSQYGINIGIPVVAGLLVFLGLLLTLMLFILPASRAPKLDKADWYFGIGMIIAVASVVLGHFWK